MAEWAFSIRFSENEAFFHGVPRNSYRGGKERSDFWKKFEIKILVLDISWPRTLEEQPRSSIIRGGPLISSIHATCLVTQVPSTGSDSLTRKEDYYVVSIKSWWRYLEIAGGLITSGGNEKIVLWLDEDITGLWLSFANEMNVK